MWSAFTKGFAEGATDIIKEREKEISDRALVEMESLLRKKTKADADAIERRDELRKQANELRARSGNRLTESQIVGILESGYGEIALEKLKSKTVSADKMAQLFTPTNPDDKRLIEDYIKEATTLTGKAPEEVEEISAFGLRSRAGSAERQRVAVKAGMPLSEMYQTELPEMGTKPTGTIDLSIFEDEASIKEMEDSLVKTIINPEATREDKRTATQKLAQIRAAQDIGKKKEGSEIKESDVRSNLRLLDATIKRSIAGPGDLVVYTDPVTNQQSLELSNDIDPKVREQIEARRKEAFKAYTDEFYGQTGSIPTVVKRVMGAFLGPAQTVPAAAPVAPPPLPKGMTVETLRAQAKEKIQKSPEKADVVRKVFKQQTGEDL